MVKKQKIFNITSMGIHWLWTQISREPLVYDNWDFFHWIPCPRNPLYAKCGRDLKGPYCCKIPQIWKLKILNVRIDKRFVPKKSILGYLKLLIILNENLIESYGYAKIFIMKVANVWISFDFPKNEANFLTILHFMTIYFFTALV
jgi:hypothetical protein